MVLEGLPGAGKSLLLEVCRQAGYQVVPEIVLPEIGDLVGPDEAVFLKNDLVKLQQARGVGGVVVIDRGFLSTLAHNYAYQMMTGDRGGYDLAMSKFSEAKQVGLMPDCYIWLDLDIASSLARKDRPIDSHDPWTSLEGLTLIQQFYQTAFAKFEPEVELIKIDAGAGLEKVSRQVLGILEEIKTKIENWNKLVGMVKEAFGESYEKAGGRGFRYFHSLNVARIGKSICQELGYDEATTKLVMVAGLFHDIGKAERVGEGGLLDGSRQAEVENNLEVHEELSAKFVRERLTNELSVEEQTKIAMMIVQHDAPQDELAKVLHDADELSEMGVMNIWRMATYSAEKHRDMATAIAYWFDDERAIHLDKSSKLYLEVSRLMASQRIEAVDKYFNRLKKEISNS